MLKVKCPAKINLTLEIINKRADGYHDIQSVMQTIDLFDYLTIDIEKSCENIIELSGSSTEIPYDSSNLVHKAGMLFLDKLNQTYKVKVFIEKNIPIAAGLAGGSSDAAGILLGLNELLNQPFSKSDIHELCSKLGSDLNFCLEGGCKLATGRGEILQPLSFKEFDVTLIKPKHLGVSAKEAYTKYSNLLSKPKLNKTKEFINGDFSALQNDLEYALIEDYKELQLIKKKYPNSLMTGSGSTFFVLERDIPNLLDDRYEIIEGLKSIDYGAALF